MTTKKSDGVKYYVLNEQFFSGRKHGLLFIDRWAVNNEEPWLFLLTDRVPARPYESKYLTVGELLRTAEEYDDHFNGLYEFVNDTLDDPVIKLFLDVMGME